jgi:hypothetical protein
MFAARGALNLHFEQQEVLKNSVWIDVKNAPKLKRNESHSIIVAESGHSANLFSREPHILTVVDPSNARSEILQPTSGTRESLTRLYVAMYDVLYEHLHSGPSARQESTISPNREGRPVDEDAKSSMPIRYMDDDVSGLLDAIGYIAATFFEASWLLVLEPKRSAS